MHYGFVLSTKDIDIVSLRSPLEQEAVALGQKSSRMAQALGLYLEAVPQALPPLPRWFRSRAEALVGGWRVLRLWKLEVHDFAVTKLKCFRPQDREDLQALCDRGLLKAAELRKSLEEAFPYRSPKAEDAEDDPDNPDWGRALANCKRVEDYLNGRIRSI
jgi:hypothetical protein